MKARTSWIVVGLVVLAGMAGGAWPWPDHWKRGSGATPAAAEVDPTNAVTDPAAREALLTAPALAAENERLRLDVEALEAQVTELTVSLAEAQYANDRLQVQLDRLPTDAAVGPGGLNAAALTVAEVNRELGLVVLDAGASAGVKPGMVFGLVREETVIARVRTVDVRERIAGAKVEALTTDAYPEKGDRAVVWRSMMR